MEETNRTKFLMLDILAKRRGGIAKLTSEEKIIYLQTGISEGFIPVQEAYEIAKKFNINDNYILKELFSGLDKVK